MPAWAAADNSLVYVTNRNGPEEIWLRQNSVPDRPIVSPRDFPPDTTLGFMAPALSPRGDRVIYTRIERGGFARLWISAVAGGTPIRATRDDDRPGEFAGAWSPDGAWFVYYGVRDDKQELVKVQTTGEGLPVLLKAAAAETRDVPHWSPTGEWIQFANSLISADGKTERSPLQTLLPGQPRCPAAS